MGYPNVIQKEKPIYVTVQKQRPFGRWKKKTQDKKKKEINKNNWLTLKNN